MFWLLSIIFNSFGGNIISAKENQGESIKALENKRILFISSYSESFITVPEQLAGILSVFQSHGANVDFEYMDTKRLSSEENIQHFYTSLKFKLKNLPTYDAIIVGDDTALQFAMDKQEELFDAVPIVFFGINDKDRAMLADALPNMAGSIEETSIIENLEIAYQFNSSATKVIGIVDGTLTGQGDKKQLEAASRAFEALEFNTLNVSEYTFEEFGKILEGIGEDTILLFQSMNQDSSGNYLDLEDQFEFLREHTRVPVFRASVGGIGKGLLGGRMIDYKKMGVNAAETVYQILTGTSIDTMELVRQTPYYYIFDYELIQKYKIDENRIPDGAVLYNKEVSPLERYSKLIIAAGVIFLFLSIITVVLIIDNIKRRKMQKELQESHEELVSIYEELTASEEELEVQYEKIEKMAKHDYLTGLPNRFHFVERLSRELKNYSYGAVMLLDIDNFKGINDTLGHVYGDHLLRIIAERFHKITDEKLFCARLGGDEFLILLSQVQEQKEIDEYVKRIQMLFDEAFLYEENENYISFSMGVTLYPKDSNNLDQLIMNADAAMYQVKHGGKNNYIYYHENMKNEITSKKEIEGILRQALKEKGFHLCYQPQVDAKTGDIASFEALLRLNDHNISPGIFIPVAEETGHIIEIGRWITEEAIMQLDSWRKKGYQEKIVSINYSSKQMRDKHYITYLKHLLKEYDISPKFIEIEITESIFLEDDTQTLEFLKELKEAGIKIALDDFGTGYSSLNYLTYIPVDKLKLDKSINDKFLLSENIGVMDSIISLAHSLRLKITAEGIEDMDKYLQLRHSGCDYIQGYLFSKPLKAEEIEKIYNRNLLERMEYNMQSLL
jgi:diguanylate cyclase (GGDEF)-like protein